MMADHQDTSPTSDASQQPLGPPPGQHPAGPPAAAQPPPPAAAPSHHAPPAPAGPQPATGVGQPADLVTRFLAKLIDSVLLGVTYGLLVTFLLLGLVFGALVGGSSGGFIASAISTLVSTALFIGYFAYMESSQGQTVGKMLMKIEVRGPDGQYPTLEQALKRNAYLAIGLVGIIPILGTLLAPLLSLGATIAIAVTINSNTATRQGWHDLFADGTSVIKVG
jgi:uncharacterized RDD family membrane protein YckC